MNEHDVMSRWQAWRIFDELARLKIHAIMVLVTRSQSPDGIVELPTAVYSIQIPPQDIDVMRLTNALRLLGCGLRHDGQLWYVQPPPEALPQQSEVVVDSTAVEDALRTELWSTGAGGFNRATWSTTFG